MLNKMVLTIKSDKKIAITYARVSTKDQTSTEAQIGDMDYELPKIGRTMIARFEEKKTAVDKDDIFNPIDYLKLRPILYSIYVRAKEKHDFDELWVWKMDRFARSDFQEILIKMFKKEGVEIVSLRDSHSDIERKIMGVFSVEEINKIRMRVELKHQLLIKEKKLVSRPPLGYQIINEKLMKHDFNAKSVKKIFELAAKKIHPKKICEQVTIIRKKKDIEFEVDLPMSTYYRVIRNSIYIGKYKWRDKEIDGLFEPIISEELFDKVNND